VCLLQECVWDGPLTLQAEEVDSVHPMTLDEILSRDAAGEQFAPDGMHAVRLYRERSTGDETCIPAAEPSTVL
jgi:hypothetical protein